MAQEQLQYWIDQDSKKPHEEAREKQVWEESEQQWQHQMLEMNEKLTQVTHDLEQAQVTNQELESQLQVALTQVRVIMKEEGRPPSHEEIEQHLASENTTFELELQVKTLQRELMLLKATTPATIPRETTVQESESSGEQLVPEHWEDKEKRHWREKILALQNQVAQAQASSRAAQAQAHERTLELTELELLNEQTQANCAFLEHQLKVSCSRVLVEANDRSDERHQDTIRTTTRNVKHAQAFLTKAQEQQQQQTQARSLTSVVHQHQVIAKLQHQVLTLQDQVSNLKLQAQGDVKRRLELSEELSSFVHLQRVHEDLSVEYESLEVTYESLVGEHDELQRAHKNAETTVRTSEREIETLTQALERQTQQTCVAERTLGQVSEELATQQTSVRQLRQSRRETEEHNHRLTRDVDHLSEKLQSSRQDYVQQSQDRAQELGTFLREKEDTRNYIRTLESEVELAETEVHRMSGQMRECECECDALRRQAQAQRQALARMKSNVSKHEMETLVFKSEGAKARHRLEVLRKRLEAVSSENQDLRTSVKESQAHTRSNRRSSIEPSTWAEPSKSKVKTKVSKSKDRPSSMKMDEISTRGASVQNTYERMNIACE